MQIQKMFERDIDRPISAVVKPEQLDQESKRIELEEYVVTKELIKHFSTFFSNYTYSITNKTDEIGAWISGFYGSGKSHFLKILSYILNNEEVNGKNVIDYFLDKPLIVDDPIVMNNMRVAGQHPTKAILFDIPSKAPVSINSDSSAIALTFNRVFNEMQGYSSETPALADLERELDEEGKYEEFKAEVEKLSGLEYTNYRRKFKIKRHIVKDALVNIGFMPEESASVWIKDAVGSYDIAIDQFVERVKHYIDKTGNRVVFLVDEAGQFMAKNSSIMLDFQALAHELGAQCKGKAWLIVTAQEDLKHMTDELQNRDDEFSKIQGRFRTRLSLSSVNADEVIKERILKKNEAGADTLKALYESRETDIAGRIEFKETTELKQIKSAEDFVICYPFLPYQFNLLSDVFKALINNNAAAKNNSEGERSLLEAFQHAAKTVEMKEDGALAPFYLFYDVLGKYLDHTHAGVIQRAEENERLNPTHSSDCFTVNVLKTLFLLKYIKGVPLTVSNIQALMYTSIDEDKVTLKQNIEEALGKLTRELLVSQIKDTYEFLTDEEQDINREIEKRNIQNSDVQLALTHMVYEQIYTQTRFKVARAKGRYTFAYNQMVDDIPLKNNQNNEIGCRVVTPLYVGGKVDSLTMCLKTAVKHEVALVLPTEITSYIKDMKRALKIEDYMKNVSDPKRGKSSAIRFEKTQEAVTCRESAVAALKEAIGQAEIYINGNAVTDISIKDATSRINEAMEYLVDGYYYKLSYMDTPKDDVDIKELFNSIGNSQITLGGMQLENSNALTAVKEYISDVTGNHTMVSMKNIVANFSIAPFGFIESDTRWLVAKLFVDGNISANVDKEPITIFNRSKDNLAEYFTSRKYIEKLLFMTTKSIEQFKIKNCKDVLSELFLCNESTNDPVKLMDTFCKKANEQLTNYRRMLTEHDRVESQYPGAKILKSAIDTIEEIVALSDINLFFDRIATDKNDLLDLAEDITPVVTFYNSDNQKKIFSESGLQIIALYESSKEYLTTQNVEPMIEKIKAIITAEKPYGQIKDLPSLKEAFMSSYDQVVATMKKPVLETIAQYKQNALDSLTRDALEEAFKNDIEKNFGDIADRANTCVNVSELQSFKNKASSVYTNFLDQISRKAKQLAEEQKKKDEENNQQTAGGADNTSSGSTTVVKDDKNVLAHDLTTEWRIETEADLDKYLGNLKKQILNQMDEEHIVVVRFQ